MVNTENIAEENKISLEDIKKNPNQISQLSYEDLKSFFDQEKDTDDYDLISSLSKELGSRKQKEEIQENPELQKKLAEDKIKQDQENAKKRQEMSDQRKKNKQEQSDQEKDLRSQLFERDKKINSLEEKIKAMKLKLTEITTRNSSNLNDVLEAKKSGNSEKLEELLAENKRLKEEKATMKQEVLKYPGGNIRTLRTRRITGGITLNSSKTEKGRKVELNMNRLGLVKNLRTRRKLNKTIRKFNDIGSDPKKGVIYIMSKANKRQGGIIRSEFKKIWNTLTIRDKDKFDEIFNKQKKKFIDDLFGNMSGKLTVRDEKIKESISRRIDYYQKAYKRKMMTV
ncbi:MAG TPA: hypothetical protein VJ892_03570 [Candidatus Absconditabacterales bacterium]|nr:hypothetical protein [Candidatus Absconditabacterales bacterium]